MIDTLPPGEPCFLGVDIGTYQTKAVITTIHGDLVAEARRDHKMLTPRPGWAEHRPEEDWWGDLVATTREALHKGAAKPDQIRAVGCSGIGPCMAPVDAQCRPLMNAALYGVDTRASAEVDALTARIGADALMERSGAPLTSQAVGPKILWLRNTHPDLFEKTARIHTCTSFLVERLTGEAAIDHYSAVNANPLYDLATLGYSDALADDVTPLDRLPRPAWSTEVVGEVTAAAAAETGLAPGTPVIAGTIDAASEAVSVGVREPGDLMLMYGSSVFVISVTPARVRHPALWTAPWLYPDQHAAMAGLATAGTLTHWFRDKFAPELPKETAFPTLAAEAAATPAGAEGVLALPYFSGERTEPDARGLIFGLTLTQSRGVLFRAFLEGIAYGTNRLMDEYEAGGARPTRVYAVGGGVNNAVWAQATSDVTGLAQVVRRTTIGASYGDAFLAALGVGAVAPADIETWNPIDRVIEPNPDYAALYAERYGVFRDLFERTKDLTGRSV